MKDEIKEYVTPTLEYLKTMSRENESNIELSREEVKLLLDYTTNLQEENKRLKNELEEETLNKEIAQGHRKQLQDIELQERKEIDRLNNIINELEKILQNEWIYYDQIVFNTHAEFDDEEQVNRFWKEYGAKLMLKNIQDKLKELKENNK